jgi:hypothetical protein
MSAWECTTQGAIKLENKSAEAHVGTIASRSFPGQYLAIETHCRIELSMRPDKIIDRIYLVHAISRCEGTRLFFDYYLKKL